MAEDTVINDERIQCAVRALFEGVAPERASELHQLWEDYSPRFNLAQDITPTGRFVVEAGAYREVRYNHRALRCIWIASFIAWEGYAVINEYLRGGSADLSRMHQLIGCFERILTEDASRAVPLPDGIPEPGVPREDQPVAQRATADLAHFAVGWVLLHEVRHLKHQQDGSAVPPDADPVKRHGEEISCDEYATEFLLSQTGAFAKSEAVEARLVRLKREIGIYFALFALTLVGKNRGWAESDSHPSIESRIWEVRKIMGPDAVLSGAIACAAFAALRILWPGAPFPFDQDWAAFEPLAVRAGAQSR